MTGRCKKCKEKNMLYKRNDDLYCYSCYRIIPVNKPIIHNSPKGRKIKS